MAVVDLTVLEVNSAAKDFDGNYQSMNVDGDRAINDVRTIWFFKTTSAAIVVTFVQTLGLHAHPGEGELTPSNLTVTLGTSEEKCVSVPPMTYNASGKATATYDLITGGTVQVIKLTMV